MKNIITKEKILQMSYTEFIGFINQCNVPPGSFSTLNEWRVFGDITENSRVLEVACTTGFSGREIARLTGCSVVGIDICNSSIESAKINHKKYGPDLDLEYHCANAYEYNPGKKFTHIILGAAIGFFPDKEKLMEKVLALLEDGGRILVSPYYVQNRPIPQNLIEDAKRIIGIDPTNFDYYTSIDPYKNFEVLYESRKNIIKESITQMKKYCEDTANRACFDKKIKDKYIYNCLYDRLYEIKNICNKLHEIQFYSVIVLRYRKEIYPNRFVELF